MQHEKEIEEAIKATQTVLFDREKRDRIILNARQYAESLNWENATKILKEIFRMAIETKSDML